MKHNNNKMGSQIGLPDTQTVVDATARDAVRVHAHAVAHDVATAADHEAATAEANKKNKNKHSGTTRWSNSGLTLWSNVV